MRDLIQRTLKEINQCSTRQFIIVIISGIIGILWPLGGLILYLISRKTNFKLYGKIAIYCAVVALLAYAFKLIVTLLTL